jgi:DNA-binding XRE family transcriptional regulator
MRSEQARTQRRHDQSGVAEPTPVRRFIEGLTALLSGSQIVLDRPSQPDGEWFIDVACGRFKSTIAWRLKFGFGIFTSEETYGDRPNEIFRQPETAVLRIQQLYERWNRTKKISAPGLSELRQLVGVQQAELAQLLDLNQPAISRFENRGDVKVSTLNSYVEAIGGRLEMRVHFDELDVSIDLAP